MDSSVITQSSPKEVLLQAYLDSLCDKEMKSYLIAKSHLGTSFQLYKSIGYIEWKNTLPL
jgi:hypothetical protein